MPTVTYLGDDSNQASVKWANTLTLEEITFPLNVPVNVDPDAPENASRKPLVKHIVKKLSSTDNKFFKLEGAKKVKQPKAGED